jgi:dihydrofolate reductase
MRKLIYSMTVSLDGYIAGPDGTIDWTVPDEELFRFHTQQVQETGVHLCGRRLYRGCPDRRGILRASSGI